jgi:cephalosporin hydroxylase
MVNQVAKWWSYYGGPPILTHIDEQEAVELMWLAQDREIFEIGSASGFSSITMALAGAKHITTIDLHEDENPGSQDELWFNIVSYGLEEAITPLKGDSKAYLISHDETFDLIHVDGDHSPKGCLADCQLSWPLVRAGGTLAVHDYGTGDCDGVRQTLDSLWPSGADKLVGTLWIKHKPA